jgi:hypothetical protein
MLDANAQYMSKVEGGQLPTPPESVDSTKRECGILSLSVEEAPPTNMSLAPIKVPELGISSIIEADLCV